MAALLILLLCAAGPDQDPAIESEHARNPVYRSLLEDGLDLGGTRVPFPAPILRDGQDAGAQRRALEALAGSARKLEDLLRDSVSAPFILRPHDDQTADGDPIRSAGLWFVVHADLDAIDPDESTRRIAGTEAVEAGNMRFEGRLLVDEELKARGITPDPRERYVHTVARLLDRIHVEATDRVVVSRSEESLVIASRTDDAFDGDEAYPNRWWPIARRGGRDEPGPSRHFDGGAGYVKIARLRSHPGALLVEAHFSFLEPKDWFDAAPILRSKLSLIAQDRIRGLRREIARDR